MSDRQNRRNYYRILHVQPDAPLAVLKSSWRAIMRHLEMHPDRGGDHWNAALVNEAYEVLSDPERRAAYDLTMDFMQVARGRPAPPADGETSDRTAAGQGSETSEPAAGSERANRSPSAPPTGSAPNGQSSGWPRRRPSPTPGFVDTPSVSKIENSECLFCGSTWAVAAADSPVVVCAVCKSPLSLDTTPQLEDPGRRAARRIEREGTIRVFLGWPDPSPTRGQIVDLSPVGMQFTTRAPIEQYRIIKLEGVLLDAVASVANCREHDGAFAIGVQFHTVRFHQGRGTFLSTEA